MSKGDLSVSQGRNVAYVLRQHARALSSGHRAFSFDRHVYFIDFRVSQTAMCPIKFHKCGNFSFQGFSQFRSGGQRWWHRQEPDLVFLHPGPRRQVRVTVLLRALPTQNGAEELRHFGARELQLRSRPQPPRLEEEGHRAMR